VQSWLEQSFSLFFFCLLQFFLTTRLESSKGECLPGMPHKLDLEHMHTPELIPVVSIRSNI